MSLTEQRHSQLLTRRKEWEAVAILAIQSAFNCTPAEEHQDLLDNIYNQIIHRVFNLPPHGNSHATTRP